MAMSKDRSTLTSQCKHCHLRIAWFPARAAARGTTYTEMAKKHGAVK